MPRLIVELGSGAQAASVQASIMSVQGVEDAVTAQQAHAIIVTVPEVTASVRQQLASLPNVTAVHEDIQAVPQEADPGAIRDF